MFVYDFVVMKIEIIIRPLELTVLDFCWQNLDRASKRALCEEDVMPIKISEGSSRRRPRLGKEGGTFILI